MRKRQSLQYILCWENWTAARKMKLDCYLTPCIKLNQNGLNACSYVSASVQFSRSVVSGSLRPHGLQLVRLPCPSPTPAACSTHVHWVGDVIQPSHPLSPSHPLLPLSPPALILSQLRVFSNESILRIRWPKDWSFSFSISPSNEYWGLISFRIDLGV